MSTQPEYNEEPFDLSTEIGRKRWQEHLRAAGITPATDFEEREGRIVFRKPSRLLGMIRSVLRFR